MFKEINEWEVLTPSGWSNFTGIMKSEKKEHIVLYFNEFNIKCSTDHIFFIKNKKTKAKDIKIGDFLDTCNGLNEVIRIEQVDEKLDTYDLVETANNTYIIDNGIVTKNCDEFAFVPENVANSYWSSAFPTISQGGRVIIVSTPNGTSGLFYEIYMNAVNKKNTFKNIRIVWDRHPDRDENWKEVTLQAVGKVKFAREFQCSFEGSTNTLIDGNILSKMKWEDPIQIPENGFEIWKPAIKGHIYALGVDVAKGSNSDYSVINIFDITYFTQTGKYEQVGLFRRNDILLFEFIDKVHTIAKYYNNGVIVVENNQLGDVVCQTIHNDKEYENLYFDYETTSHGVNANVKTKPLALSYLKQDIESESIKIYSSEMVKELNYYEESRPGIFAAKKAANCHDDTVASAYWISYILRTRYMDDIMFYAGKSSNQSDGSRDESEKDVEILNSFNKYIKPITQKDSFRRDLSR